MSTDIIPGFTRAQAAWENANPYDSDCTCSDDDLYICEGCGEQSDKPAICPEGCTNDTEMFPLSMREATAEEKAELNPAQGCPAHGWCAGCTSRHCEDCGGGY